MPRSSKGQGSATRVQGSELTKKIRIILGGLLALNLIAAGLLVFPPGGSADDLEHQLVSLQSQLAQRRAVLESSRRNVAAVEKARSEGDHFLDEYFLPRRSADSVLLAALTESANKAQIKEKDSAQVTDYIEGSDSLSMMTITANFEGTYRNLLNFIGEIDRSGQLLIIESMSATPQQGSNILTVSMKIDAFIRDGSVESAIGTAQTVALGKGAQ